MLMHVMLRLCLTVMISTNLLEDSDKEFVLDPELICTMLWFLASNMIITVSNDAVLLAQLHCCTRLLVFVV